MAEPVWCSLYPASAIGPDTRQRRTLVDEWRHRVDLDPQGAALVYFDGHYTAAEVDAESTAWALALKGLGVGRGDRVGIYLQNIPQFPLTLLALWKLGAIGLLLNPMYRSAELRNLIDDSGAVGIICLHDDVDVVSASVAASSVAWIVGTSASDYQDRDDPRVFAAPGMSSSGALDYGGLVARFRGRPLPNVVIGPENVALLTYTSGTTGPPKGAMSTHGNVLAVVSTFGRWLDLGVDDVVLGLAPLFHITGAVVNAALALLSGSCLVLANRFHPEVVLEAIADHRVTFTVGSITAFNAISALPQARREHFASVRLLYSGGAPIPPATVDRLLDQFGIYIHNAFGMTETTSAVVAVPPGRLAPVHHGSGTLSVGVPLPGVKVRVLDASGAEQPPGVQGELEIDAPQVVSGYWHKPEDTARSMPGGRMLSGDVAIVDEQGWVYLVDRLKDQINVSGYKVWPREIEDRLYEHPAVHEAAVVGQPDDYRGETVVAYVSLRAGEAVSPDELIGFARAGLAAYKCPRVVHILDDLPKTQSGKIRRNVLRETSGH